MDSEPLVAGIRQIIPQKYKVSKLNLTNLQTVLAKAPMEFTAAAKTQNLTLDLPMPGGSYETFFINESPIMEPELAKKFPEIKTYSGFSSKNSAITVRFDLTPKGFHGMVFSPEGTFFIDPYSTNSIEYYISYNKIDYVSNKSFSCGVEQIQQISIDNPNKEKTNINIDSPRETTVAVGDGVLRTYRLALAATGEYTTYHGGTVASALAAQVTTMNRVNGVFLKDFAVKMLIIANNNLVIYSNSATDPYTNDDGFLMLDENMTNLQTTIGLANFDIGHVFSTGGGGVAYLGSTCGSFKGGGVTGSGAPVGDAFDIDYVAHEMGHQFGGNHTQNNSCERNSATAFEPGSASTIMGYAGICVPNVQLNSDPYFHGGNLVEMHSFITGAGNSCAVKPTYSNNKPLISSNTTSQTIPKSTPFVLSGTATDADGIGSLTYCWEQMDNQTSTHAPVSTSTIGPNFRSFNPSNNGSRYFPRLTDLVANVTPTWEVLPSVGRTLNFRLVVRDNATDGGAIDRTENVVLTVDGNSGPFQVSIPSALGISWPALSTQTVTWNVNNTNIAPVSCANVDILLSTDGGLTYPTTLLSNVANNGSASITIPNQMSSTARVMVRGTGRAFFDISNNNFTITAESPCPSTLELTTNITSGTNTFKALQTIVASNKVMSPAIVNYQAGNSISLNAGFEAQNGAVFSALIGGCN